jgi:hypothetical protein
MKKAGKEVTFLRNIFGKFLKGKSVKGIEYLYKEKPAEIKCGYIKYGNL